MTDHDAATDLTSAVQAARADIEGDVSDAWRPEPDCPHCHGTGQLIAGSQHNTCHCFEL